MFEWSGECENAGIGAPIRAQSPSLVAGRPTGRRAAHACGKGMLERQVSRTLLEPPASYSSTSEKCSRKPAGNKVAARRPPAMHRRVPQLLCQAAGGLAGSFGTPSAAGELVM